MSLLLHLYPTYQSAKCILNPETTTAVYQHWLVYWMSAYVVEQLPLPGMISYPVLALLCIPESTAFVRDNIISKGLSVVDRYWIAVSPVATAKAYEIFGRYIQVPTQNSAAWWQFWKSQNTQHDHNE